VLCEAIAICGTRSLRVTILALFYEPVERRTKTKKIKKKQQHNNKLDKINKTTNSSKIAAICAQNVYKFIFMLDFSICRTSKGNFPNKVY